MLITIICAIIGWSLFSLILAYVEAKKAPIIDDNLSVYNREHDPIVRYKKTYCDHCHKCLNEYCNNGIRFGKIGDDIIRLCKSRNLFIPK